MTHVDRTSFDPDAVRQIGRLDLAARMIAAGLHEGLRRARSHGFSSEFSDFKPYTPGEDLRYLDWRAYARSDRLFIRRFDAETDVEHLLLLDATASMAWRWKDNVSKLQFGVNLLASIACLCVKGGDRVGLAAHDASDIHTLPAQKRPDHLDRVFDVLERLTPAAGDAFADLVASAVPLAGRPGVIVMCADLEEDQADIERSLHELKGARARVYLLHILDRAEEIFPFAQATHLRDSETGELMAINARALAADHRATVDRFRGRWRATCEVSGITYVPVHTGMNYVDVLLSIGSES